MKLLAVLLFALLAFGSCTKSETAQPTRQITPMEVQGMLSNDFAVVVDVREADERAEKIDRARWVPMSKIEKDDPAWEELVHQLPKDKTVVFHCVGGVRARKAAEKLSAQGYKTAYFKGVDEWRAAGLPLTKGQ